MSPTPIPPSNPSNLRELVAAFKAQPKKQAILSRKIVGLAREQQLTDAQFRTELRAGKLDDSRISEFICILNHPTAAPDFTRAEKPLSFRTALRVARGQSSTSRSKPNSEAQLPRQADQLIAWYGTATPWVIDCGVFQLRFRLGEPAPPANPPGNAPAAVDEDLVRVVIPLASETETALARLSKRSGLARAATARVLLEGAPWAELLPASAAAAPAPPPPAGKKFYLSRRKNPARLPEAVCRLPVKLPEAVADRLTALGATLGLSRVETANLLLEPNPRQRVQEARAALARALQARLAECDLPVS